MDLTRASQSMMVHGGQLSIQHLVLIVFELEKLPALTWQQGRFAIGLTIGVSLVTGTRKGPSNHLEPVLRELQDFAALGHFPLGSD
jgi:hypothetical protein